MQVFLETDRLILRQFTADDADLIVELDSDPEVRRHVQLNPTTRKEAAGEILPAWLRYYDRYRGYGFWAAIERASGDFIGWFHLRPGLTDGRDDEPDLGYRLRRASWGRGYATEGSRALIDKAFIDLEGQPIAHHGIGDSAVESLGEVNMRARRLTIAADCRSPTERRVAVERNDEPTHGRHPVRALHRWVVDGLAEVGEDRLDELLRGVPARR